MENLTFNQGIPVSFNNTRESNVNSFERFGEFCQLWQGVLDAFFFDSSFVYQKQLIEVVPMAVHSLLQREMEETNVFESLFENPLILFFITCAFDAKRSIKSGMGLPGLDGRDSEKAQQPVEIVEGQYFGEINDSQEETSEDNYTKLNLLIEHLLTQVKQPSVFHTGQETDLNGEQVKIESFIEELGANSLNTELESKVILNKIIDKNSDLGRELFSRAINRFRSSNLLTFLDHMVNNLEMRVLSRNYSQCKGYHSIEHVEGNGTEIRYNMRMYTATNNGLTKIYIPFLSYVFLTMTFEGFTDCFAIGSDFIFKESGMEYFERQKQRTIAGLRHEIIHYILNTFHSEEIKQRFGRTSTMVEELGIDTVAGGDAYPEERDAIKCLLEVLSQINLELDKEGIRDLTFQEFLDFCDKSLTKQEAFEELYKKLYHHGGSPLVIYVLTLRSGFEEGFNREEFYTSFYHLFEYANSLL